LPAPLGPGWRVTGGGVMATHWQDACVDAVAKLPPVWHPGLGDRPRAGLRPLAPVAPVAKALHPTSPWSGRPMPAPLPSPARALGTWLACHWWRRDGKVLAGCVSRCCREAAARLGTPFRGTIPGRASLLGLGPLSPRRDSSRLINEMAH